jgi:hypothetical protein
MPTWFSLMKFVVIVALFAIFVWFIYVSQICLGLFFIAISILGLLWARTYLEGQFSPERSD